MKLIGDLQLQINYSKVQNMRTLYNTRVPIIETTDPTCIPTQPLHLMSWVPHPLTNLCMEVVPMEYNTFQSPCIQVTLLLTYLTTQEAQPLSPLVIPRIPWAFHLKASAIIIEMFIRVLIIIIDSLIRYSTTRHREGSMIR